MAAGTTLNKESLDCVFGEPWKNSDVVLIVEKKKIYVHSTILSFASPVFEKMILESKNKEIELPGKKKFKDVERVMKILYPRFELGKFLSSRNI